MKRFENQVIEFFDDRSTGKIYSDIEFINCRFLRCNFSSIGLANLDNLDLVGLRSVARRVSFVDCEVRGVGDVGPGIVEDSLIDGLRVVNHIQTSGTAFKHVVVKGVIDKFMITPYVDVFGHFPDVQKSFDEANREYYNEVDWALDISEAVFRDCDIRAIPSNLIRRDPSTQMVITREKALQGDWKKVDLSGTHWPVAIQFLLDYGYEDYVLVAPKKARNFKKLLEGLNRLRDAGIVEPD